MQVDALFIASLDLYFMSIFFLETNRAYNIVHLFKTHNIPSAYFIISLVLKVLNPNSDYVMETKYYTFDVNPPLSYCSFQTLRNSKAVQSKKKYISRYPS